MKNKIRKRIEREHAFISLTKAMPAQVVSIGVQNLIHYIRSMPP